MMAYTLEIGQNAPDFNLLATDEKFYSLSNYASYELLVISFTCNHCPYVIGSDEATRISAEKYLEKGIKFVCINSNSPNTYEEDSFENMQNRMKEFNFPWDYLYDSTQEIAQTFGALKTPHFFLFNQSRELIYTGRSIDNPRNPSLASQNDLETAIDEHLGNKKITTPITNPIGCNIKWDGKDAHWMPAEACDLI